MREIKFRVWDKRQGLWVAGWAIDQSGTSSETGDKVFMQFTGLTDGIGGEIYEGDIVDFYCRRDYEPTAPFYINRRKRRVVRWISDPNKNSLNIRQTVDQNIAYHKVIGNIYQNPELVAPPKPM